MKSCLSKWLTALVALALFVSGSAWAQDASAWPEDSRYTVLKTKAGSSGDPAVQSASTFVLYTSSGNVGSPCNLGANYDYRFGTGSYAGTWPTGTLTVNNNLQMVWNANITGGAKSIYFTSGRWNISDGARLAGKVSGPIYVKGAQLWTTINAHTYTNDFHFGTPTYTGDVNTGYRSALRPSAATTFNGVTYVDEASSFTADGSTATFKDFRLNANLVLYKPNANGTFVFTKLTPTGARTINNVAGAIVRIGTYVVPAAETDVLTINDWTTPTTPVTLDVTAFGDALPTTARPILKVTTGTLVDSQFTPPTGAMLTVTDSGKTLNIIAATGFVAYAGTIDAATATWSTGTGISRTSADAWTDGAANTISLENGLADPVTLTFDTDVIARSFALTGTGTTTLAKGAGTTVSIGSYDFSGATGTTTVNIDTGTSAVSAGTDTILTQAGSGALTIGEGKKATISTNWTGTIVQTGAGTLVATNVVQSVLSMPINNTTYAGAGTTVTIASAFTIQSGNLIFTDSAKLVSTQSTTIADPNASQTNTDGSRPGFRFRPSANVTFSNGATFSMPNGYLELCWDNQVANIGTGSFTVTGTGSKVSLRGIGGGNVYNGNAKLNVENGAVLEIGDMGLRHTDGGNLYTVVLNGGTLRATGTTFGIESGLAIVVTNATGTFDAGVATMTISQPITGNGSLNIKGTTGSVVLSAANTYTGTTTIESGTLKITGATSLPSASTLTMNDGTTLDISALSGSFSRPTGGLVVPVNETVTIDIGTRSDVAAGSILIGWTTMPEGNFELAGTAAQALSVVKTSTGLEVIGIINESAEPYNQAEKDLITDAYVAAYESSVDTPPTTIQVQVKTAGAAVYTNSGEPAVAAALLLGITPIIETVDDKAVAKIAYEFGITGIEVVEGVDPALTLKVQAKTGDSLGNATGTLNGTLAVYGIDAAGTYSTNPIATKTTDLTFDVNGEITISNIPMGDYRIFAVRAVEATPAP